VLDLGIVSEARVGSLRDAPLVVRIAALGFYSDPVMSWVFPDPDTRLDQLHTAFAGLLRSYLPEGGIVHILDDACASLWRAPTFHRPTRPEPSQAPPQESSAAPPEATILLPADSVERMELLRSRTAAAHPQILHWYLNVLSTIPDRQSQGLGARALAPVLAVCDSDGVPAYLESSNRRNIPFYQRQGFAVTGEIEVPDGPSLFPMWREPKVG
jgi:GNAT superfamily N-acetyltransferase